MTGLSRLFVHVCNKNHGTLNPLLGNYSSSLDALSLSLRQYTSLNVTGLLRQAGSQAVCTPFLRHASTVARAPVALSTNLKQLFKFKLSSLVVLTASAGYVVGSGDSLDWEGLIWTSLGTFGAAACANTLNQVYEISNDRLMTRTCNRPLPAGRMTRAQALAYAGTAALVGLGILYWKTNVTTTALGAANIALYAGIYTPLKQISMVNTWVGALVGAIPPMMGWSSASGQLEAGSLVLAAALFFWQMPHFLALAWLCKDDYLRGGFKMISAFDPTGKRTASAALRNSLYMLPLGLAACSLGVTSEAFAWEAAALSAAICVPAVKFVSQPSQQTARKLFKFSLLWLPLFLAAMIVHRQPNQHQLPLSEVQAQLQQHLQAESYGGGLLGTVRTTAENYFAFLYRAVFGTKIMLYELKCPSTVHSDDGHDLPEEQAAVVATAANLTAVNHDALQQRIARRNARHQGRDLGFAATGLERNDTDGFAVEQEGGWRSGVTLPGR